MPIYEYRCAPCGQTFEKIVRSHDAPAPACPSCGGDHVSKLVSAPNFQLKGSGWYKDHYGLKKSSGEGGGKSDGGASSGSGGASSGSGGGEAPKKAAAGGEA